MNYCRRERERERERFKSFRGAEYNDGNSSRSGHFRVYQNVNGTWEQIAQDIDGENEDDYSGWSVALSDDGSALAGGALFNDGNGTDSGHVRVTVCKFMLRIIIWVLVVGV